MKEPVYWQTAYARFSRLSFSLSLSLSPFSFPLSLPLTLPTSVSVSLFLSSLFSPLHQSRSFSLAPYSSSPSLARCCLTPSRPSIRSLARTAEAYTRFHGHRRRERTETEKASEARRVGVPKESRVVCVLASAREDPAVYRSLLLAARRVTACVSLCFSLSLSPPSRSSFPLFLFHRSVSLSVSFTTLVAGLSSFRRESGVARRSRCRSSREKSKLRSVLRLRI